MSDAQLPACTDDQRRADLLALPGGLNGIDYLEVEPTDHTILRVYFLRPLPSTAYGLPADLSRIVLSGGVRIVGIKVTNAQFRAATPARPEHLEVRVSQGGDYSVYALTLNAPELDTLLRRVLFSFMASCPVDVDCRTEADCPPPTRDALAIDYLAKDYASFRRMMLDLLPQLNPSFTERNPADIGITLLELFAYVGDHLSYYQDAVASEAFLETLRQRISARRHARLIDYLMHEGRNAWTHLHVAVDDAPLVAHGLPQGTCAVTRLVAPLGHETTLPGVVVSDALVTAETLERDPALASAEAFETTFPMEFRAIHNELLIHAWGDENCCLRPGTTELFVFAVPVGVTALAPLLKQGDYLLLEEVKGPRTGARADASPAHRQIVRITEEPVATTDPVYSDVLIQDALGQWQLQPWSGGGELPLLRVRWAREDALGYPFCLSAQSVQGQTLRDVTVARGNLVLVDHGLTTRETITNDTAIPLDEPFSLPLSYGPLTMQLEPDSLTYAPTTLRPITPRDRLDGDARDAKPAVALEADYPTGPELWTPVPDLLDSPPFAQQFVAEVDNDGRASLRFGDGEYGREVAGATGFTAVYRVGNGRRGNIGAEALAHLALPGPAPWVKTVRNPLPARDGTEPETIEETRQNAPQAFHATQFRAVTEADVAHAALTLPTVADAVAAFRWTGSWHTIFVGIDPVDSTDLLLDPGGRTHLSDSLTRAVRAVLTRYCLAGYDLEIRPPRFVALELDIEVCVRLDHFRADVGRAVRDALSARTLPDGTRGFFHPANFRFGQAVYLSQIYAAVERVEGVDSAVVTRFRQYGQPDNGELAAGVLPIGSWEIARLLNDPNFLEQGVLHLTLLAGKG